MTSFEPQGAEEPSAPAPAPRPSPKVSAPGLNARAPRPPAVRLRKSMVQAVVVGGAVLVSGSLAWAFVVQPQLRDSARQRQAESREDQARGVVRPTEAVTDQPASYDRLPEPRIGGSDPEQPVNGPTEVATPSPSRAYAASYPAAAAQRPSGPSPGEQAARSALFFSGSTGGSAPGPAGARPATGPVRGSQSSGAEADYGAIYNGHALVAPLSPFELKAGALVPAALLTAVDTSRPGPVIATVTQNVYDSVSGRHLLIPQGARLIGKSEGESAYGDRRAFLTWERLILPNGKSLILTSEAGVDAQGAVGLRGQVDRRLFPLLVGTLFAGAITTLGQVARDGDDGGGLLGDAGNAAAIEGSQVGGRLVDRELDVRPTIRLRAGALVRVLITRDLILEPFRP
jgi:type IV secretory pathway VirB10-like protein